MTPTTTMDGAGTPPDTEHLLRGITNLNTKPGKTYQQAVLLWHLVRARSHPAPASRILHYRDVCDDLNALLHEVSHGRGRYPLVMPWAALARTPNGLWDAPGWDAVNPANEGGVRANPKLNHGDMTKHAHAVAGLSREMFGAASNDEAYTRLRDALLAFWPRTERGTVSRHRAFRVDRTKSRAFADERAARARQLKDRGYGRDSLLAWVAVPWLDEISTDARFFLALGQLRRGVIAAADRVSTPNAADKLARSFIADVERLALRAGAADYVRVYGRLGSESDVGPVQDLGSQTVDAKSDRLEAPSDPQAGDSRPSGGVPDAPPAAKQGRTIASDTLARVLAGPQL